MSLFGEQAPPDDAVLYGILLHGPDLQNRARPEFAHIVFPDQTCKRYVARINLFHRYRDLVSDLWTPESTVLDDLDIHIRQDDDIYEDEEGAEG